MQTAVLDSRLEDELKKFAPTIASTTNQEPAESDASPTTTTAQRKSTASSQKSPARTPRTLPRAEVRRLPAISRNAVLQKQKSANSQKQKNANCCEADCGLARPEEVAGTIVRAAQEVINGARPLKMLMRWLTTDAYEALRRRMSVQARSARPTRRTVTITSCHVCRIDHDTVESTVILSDGGRIRAAVIRLEAFRGRWRATYLQTV